MLDLIIGTQLIRRDIDGRYCVNDLHKAAGGEGRHNPHYWLNLTPTKEIIELIKSSPKLHVDLTPVKTVKGFGKEQGTWVIDVLLLEYASWVSPKFKHQMFKAVLSPTVVSTSVPESTVQIKSLLLPDITPSSKSSQSSGCLYVLETEKDIVKIGKASDPDKRLTTLTSSVSYQGKRYTSEMFSNYHALESLVHDELEHRRFRRELFSVGFKDAVKVVKEVCKEFGQTPYNTVGRSV